MRQLLFSFDASRCSGCMACMVACMDHHDLGEPFLRRVIRLECGRYPEVRLAFLSAACFHCADAPCRLACPAGAIRKRAGDGVVVVQPDRCVGCGNCEPVCPFGIPRREAEGRMKKCDFCIDRIQEGLEPACVRTCPTRALGFREARRSPQHSAEGALRRLLRETGGAL